MPAKIPLFNSISRFYPTSTSIEQTNGGQNMGRFNDGPRGPVTMHKATCSACKKECEVPFQPTPGKEVFCRDCFASRRRN